MQWFPTFRRWMSRQTYPFVTTRTQSESLLRIIALAVEHQLPMVSLLRAFAADQSGIQRDRVQRLAGLLDEGISLPDALEQVPHVLPAESVLAVRFGIQSGTLSMTLRSLIENSRHSQNVQMNERLQGFFVYPALVLLVIVCIAAFLLLKILPVLERIMVDFGLESAESVAYQTVTNVGRFFVDYWWLAVGAGLLLAWILWTEKPGRSLRRVLIRPWFDTRSADVLQSLSTVAEAGRPIRGAISTLARYHHDPTLRQMLLFVCNEVEHGADLWATLQAVKLLTPAEVALMEASEKVGNRPWAMAQLASSKRRRMLCRLELVGDLVEPVTILLLAGAVFTMCLSVFGPFLMMILHSG